MDWTCEHLAMHWQHYSLTWVYALSLVRGYLHCRVWHWWRCSSSSGWLFWARFPGLLWGPHRRPPIPSIPHRTQAFLERERAWEKPWKRDITVTSQGLWNQWQFDSVFKSSVKRKGTSKIQFNLLTFCEWIHRWPVDSPHEEPVIWILHPCHNITIMRWVCHDIPYLSHIEHMLTGTLLSWFGLHWFYHSSQRIRASYQTIFFAIILTVTSLAYWRIWEKSVST